MIDENNRVLLAKRPEGKQLAGLWEFPGGKIEQGEVPEIALVRELNEELGIIVDDKNLIPLTFASFCYQDFHLLMPLWGLRIWQNLPTGMEGQEIRWVEMGEIDNFPAPPADIPLIGFLKEYLKSKCA